MNVLVTGASGFVGRALTQALEAQGDQVRPLSLRSGPPSPEALDDIDAVVHLAGESVVGLWTGAKKAAIRNSRVEGTTGLVNAMAKRPPKVMIAASAVGYYGDRGDEELDENSAPGEGFLTDVCLEWEQASQAAEALGVRVVRLRIGIVLAKGGGALGAMLTPFKLGLGGPLGSGRQWMSWIHREDLIRLILFALANEDVAGAVNATAPFPERQKDFAKQLGRALNRPAFLPVPAFALKLILGGFSAELLSSSKVLPRAGEALGFEFRYPRLPEAFQDALLR